MLREAPEDNHVSSSDAPALVRKELMDILPGLLKDALSLCDSKCATVRDPAVEMNGKPSERHTLILEKQVEVGR